MDKNKKVSIILGVVAIVVILICFLTSNVDGTGKKESIKGATTTEEIMQNAQNEAAVILEEERVSLSDIAVEDYLDFYSGDSNTLVFVGSESCPYCAIAKPIIEHLAYEYDLDVRFLNTANFSGDDESNFINSNEVFSSGFGIPILLYVGNDELIDMVDGLTDTEHYIEFLTTNKIITK